jgi:four helix bundle protein
MDLAEQAHRLTQTLPSSEQFGLAAQIRRSAVSVPANIAEGYGRQSTRSYVQFLKIARGSLLELETHVLLAHRFGYIDEHSLSETLAIVECVGKMLNGLVRAVQVGKAAVARD